MANNKQEKQFIAMQSGLSLDDAIAWISDNLNPEEVFTDEDLEDWAEANGYTNGDE